MKVTEKGTDRVAEAHVFVEGRMEALEEYGQYVDSHDKAICCYVPVEEGHKIKIEGRFSGTTLAIVYDFLVDGICRKASSSVGKSVQFQKNKKVQFETVLYQMPDGLIDTEMSVTPFFGPVCLDKETRETIGTVELRVYITRQFGVEHRISDIRKYDEVEEDADSSTPAATYKDVPPQFHMAFEKNCSIMDGPKGNRDKKKLYSKRPGTEPWAIFRFHYRTKESIIEQNMDTTYDHANKAFAKKAAHLLDLDPVPMLAIGSKPAGKSDGETSVRTSSPPAPETPSTPIRGLKKPQSFQVRERVQSPKVVIEKQPSKITPADPSPTSYMAPIEPAPATEPSVTSTAALSAFQGPQPDPSNTKDMAFDDATNTETSHENAAMMDVIGGVAAATPRNSTENVPETFAKTADYETTMKGRYSFMKALDETKGERGTESTDLIPLGSPLDVTNGVTVPHLADIFSVFDPATTSNAIAPPNILPNIKDMAKSGTKSFTSPLKKATSKPGSVRTTLSTALQKSVSPLVPVSLVKRAPEGTLTPPPDIKRIKADAMPPLTPLHVPRSLSASPSPRTLSIEAQVAEKRKLLEVTRKKRAEVARKKSILDERMAPYKQRMAEELQRLAQEMADEEAMMAEEEEELKASESMLAEFECTDGEL